jgi:hypothetical protein
MMLLQDVPGQLDSGALFQSRSVTAMSFLLLSSALNSVERVSN